MEFILIILILAVAVFAFVEIRRAVHTYLKFRGKMVVSCPETHQPAAVRVAARDAAFRATLGNDQIKLRACSRWPEKEGCGQECLRQIETSPHDCLVRNIVSLWFEGKSCAFCHKPFSELHWHDHPPALVDEDRKTVLWSDIPPEKIHEVLRTHWPVCWDCHIAETFRREHPELVVDAPKSKLRMTLYR